MKSFYAKFKNRYIILLICLLLLVFIALICLDYINYNKDRDLKTNNGVNETELLDDIIINEITDTTKEKLLQIIGIKEKDFSEYGDLFSEFESGLVKDYKDYVKTAIVRDYLLKNVTYKTYSESDGKDFCSSKCFSWSLNDVLNAELFYGISSINDLSFVNVLEDEVIFEDISSNIGGSRWSHDNLIFELVDGNIVLTDMTTYEQLDNNNQYEYVSNMAYIFTFKLNSKGFYLYSLSIV